MKGIEIIKKAKEELKNFIVQELGLLYITKGWQDEEFNASGDMFFEFEREYCPTMDVWVTDAEGNDYTERALIERLVVNASDDTFFIEVENNREYYLCDLDVELLAEIANIIERDYLYAKEKDTDYEDERTVSEPRPHFKESR